MTPVLFLFIIALLRFTIATHKICEIKGNHFENDVKVSRILETESSLKVASIDCHFKTKLLENKPYIHNVTCASSNFFLVASTSSVTFEQQRTSDLKYLSTASRFQLKFNDTEITIRLKHGKSIEFTISALETDFFSDQEICNFTKQTSTVHLDFWHLFLYIFIFLSILSLVLIKYIDDVKEAKRVLLLQQIRSRWLDKVAFLLRYLVTDEFFVFLGPTIVMLAPVDVGLSFLANSSFSEILNGVLKWIYQKPRPFWVLKGVQNIGGIWEQDYSFPSSHATTSAVFVSLLMIKLDTGAFGFLLMFFSLFAGISRVYLGVHPWSHVIIGWIFGVTQVLLFVELDLVDWVAKLETSEQITIAFAFPVVVYSTLYAIRKYVPSPHQETLSKWSEIAVYNTKKEKLTEKNFIQARRLDKYNFQIWGFFAGQIGFIFAIKLLRNGSLRFLAETRTYEDLPVLLFRLLFCFVVLSLIFIIVFIVAPKIRKQHEYIGIFIQCVFLGLGGFWASFGTGYFSYLFFGLETPIFQCKNNELNLNKTYYHNTMLNLNLTTCSMHSINPTILKHPKQIEPRNVEELKNIIIEAGKKGNVLRARGSFHSYPVHLHSPKYDERVKFVSLRNFRQYKLLEENGRKIVIAGAGICLGKSIYNPGCTTENSLTYKLWQDGLAIPNLSGISLQTLSGFLSTDTQGGSLHYQLKQSVIGYRWVNGLGELREVWKNDTQRIGEFYSIGVSMGLAGIFYEIMLEPEPRYCVHVTTMAVDDPFEKINGISKYETILLDKNQDYSRVLLLAGLDHHDEWKSYALVMNANRMNIPFEKTHNCDGKAKNLEPVNFYPRSLLNAVMGAETIQQNFDECKKELNSDVCNSNLLRISLESSVSRLQKIQVERCIKTLHEDMIAPTVTSAHKRRLGPTPKILQACWDDLLEVIDHDESIGRYYLNLPFDDQTETHSHETILMSEIFFPLDTNSATKVIDAFYEYLEIYKNRYSSLLVYWELYSCPPSEFYMSPCYNTTAIRFSLFSALRIRPKDEDQKDLWETFWNHFYMRGLKFRFHWGKVMPAWLPDLSTKIMKDAVESYPMLQKWRAFISKEDPHHVFVSKYWERTGLLKS